jgi:hypothetical protein
MAAFIVTREDSHLLAANRAGRREFLYRIVVGRRLPRKSLKVANRSDSSWRESEAVEQGREAPIDCTPLSTTPSWRFNVSSWPHWAVRKEPWTGVSRDLSAA